MRVAPLGSDLLQETTNGLARGYLRFLIDKIVVGDSTVSVWAKNPAALQTMATGTFDAALPRMGKFADTYLSGSAFGATR